MKKKILLTTALLLMFPMVAFADENEVASTATSEATVGFVVDEPTKPVDPLDPTNPGEKLQPEGEGTGNIGKLTIDYVPNLTFGTVKINRETVTVKSTNTHPFVQVTDVRGTAEGWRLQASLSEFTNEDGSHTISNAQIKMNNGNVVTNETNNAKPTVNQAIVLNAGDATNATDITTASAGNGMGTWLTTWLVTGNESLNDDVTLNLDTRDARVGNYSADITWNLIQTP